MITSPFWKSLLANRPNPEFRLSMKLLPLSTGVRLKLYVESTLFYLLKNTSACFVHAVWRLCSQNSHTRFRDLRFSDIYTLSPIMRLYGPGQRRRSVLSFLCSLSS